MGFNRPCDNCIILSAVHRGAHCFYCIKSYRIWYLTGSVPFRAFHVQLPSFQKYSECFVWSAGFINPSRRWEKQKDLTG